MDCACAESMPDSCREKKTPEEAWSGLKPLVDHFRVFGCVSHVHVPDNKRVKLDAKSFKCVLLGVSEESKAYRLFDPISKKIIISRDVVFEEDQKWNWEDDGHKQVILVDLKWETDEEAGIERESDEEKFEADEESREIESVPDQNGRNTSHGQNSLREGRARKPIVWMRDYESSQGFSDEEIAYMTHLVFFTDEGGSRDI